jgi:hypothetical protein
MSALCRLEAQSCAFDCCDLRGLCPTDPNACYYVYVGATDSGTLYAGAIVGIVLGSLVGLVVLLGVLAYCFNKQ